MGVSDNMSNQETTIKSKQKEFKQASIIVTKDAVKKLKNVMRSDDKEDYFLRMSVEGGGCSGMTYQN